MSTSGRLRTNVTDEAYTLNVDEYDPSLDASDPVYRFDELNESEREILRVALMEGGISGMHCGRCLRCREVTCREVPKRIGGSRVPG